MQGSLLVSTRHTSSSCTGAGTSEIAFAVIEKTVNDSGVLDLPISFQCKTCFDARLAIEFNLVSRTAFFDLLPDA